MLLNRFLIIKNIFRDVKINQLDSILEIGVGNAYDIRFLMRFFNFQGLIIALDITKYKAWDSIKENSNINFVIADATYLPFRSKVYDFVFLKDVLHHIRKNRKLCIYEALRVTKNGGLLRIIEANRYNVNPILVYKSCHEHDHFTLEQMYKYMRAFRFDELYYFELLPMFSFSRKIYIIWNIFVGIFFIFISFKITRKMILLYLKIKEKFFKRYLEYFVLTKKSIGDSLRLG
jgi:ubiquinone/menaquinone biosynthesis C-methylase UbiE